MDNSEYTTSRENEYVPAEYSAPSAPVTYREPERAPERETEKTVPGSARFFSLPARIGLWTVGAAAGLTILFACVLVWVGGLRYLGAIESPEKELPQGNTYNFYVNGEEVQPDSGSGQTDDYEDFFNDYFGDFFGGIFGNDDIFGDFGALPGDGGIYGGNNEDDDEFYAEEQSSNAGLGIKAVAIQLDFKIDDKYTAGIVIDTIEDYSSFIGTDVKENDMIVAANGKPTPDVDALREHFTKVGDDITLLIARYNNGVADTFEVTVKLVEMQ